jgi:G8 domain
VAYLTTTGFFYANSWSDDAIWGGDIPPRDGDVVVIPEGQTLMVDIANSPKLYSVLVEGKMMFKDGMDIEFNSGHILVMMGKLEIGTHDKPR